MNLLVKRFMVLFIVVLPFYSCDHKESKQTNNQDQHTLVFEDDGTDDWRKNWTLDGLMATVTNTEAGMELKAGNTYMNDSCHAVLWTRQVFKGNIKINYDYTRTDTVTRCVNILYFMASGKGTDAFPKDISAWKSKKERFLKCHFTSSICMPIILVMLLFQQQNIPKTKITFDCENTIPKSQD